MFPCANALLPGELRLPKSLVQPIIPAKSGAPGMIGCTSDLGNLSRLCSLSYRQNPGPPGCKMNLSKREATMRKLWALSLLTGTAIIFLVIESHAQQSEQALRSLVPRTVASCETFDLSKIERYYAADPDLTYFDL